MMRRILVALQGPDGAAGLLDLAGHLAAPADSPAHAEIQVAFISEVALPAGPGNAAASVTLGVYEAWAAGLDPARVMWREFPDGAVYAGASLGRASDLILARTTRRVVAEEDMVAGDRAARGFRDALLASGRLTLLVPAAEVDGTALLDRVVVAWDGSAGAAHALAQSLPLLARAKSVGLVIIGRNTLGEEARDAIGSYLSLHVPGARLVVRENAHRQTGRALLDALREERASLVVMGVSGRSNAVSGVGANAVLGGTILKVIEDGRVPVLSAV